MTVTTPAIMLFVRHGDQTEAARFYEETFGFQRDKDYSRGSELISIQMTTGSFKLFITGTNPVRDQDPSLGGPIHPRTPGIGGIVVRMSVVDIERTLGRAQKLGGKIHDAVGSNELGGRSAILVDPFNHMWMLDEEKAC